MHATWKNALYMVTCLSQRTTSRRKFPSQEKLRSTFHRRAYLLSLRPSCSAARFLFLRCGQIRSTFRFLRSLRRPSESAALSYIRRLILLFPYALSSRGSISFTSAGEAEVTVLPRGTPSPSTTTIHFEPLPRLVFPTSGPLFLPKQSCHRQRPLPISAVTVYPVGVEIASRLSPKHLAPPNTAIVANRCWARDTLAASPSSAPRSEEPKGCLRNTHGCQSASDPLCLVSRAANWVRLASTVRLLTPMPVVSCSTFWPSKRW